MNHITGLIITLNEAENIAECIASLRQVCEEIVVVDSGSTDKTVEIARASGAKTVVQPYLGDGPQKNVGIAYASNRWVFSLDADERILPELAEAIRKLDLENTPYDAFTVRRRNYIGDRWIRCCRWYPNPLVRLYRTDRARYSDSRQHASVGVPASRCGHLAFDLQHFTYPDTASMFAKQVGRFSARSAKILYLQGKKVHAWSPWVHGISSFFAHYVVRGGVFGGLDGLSVSLAMSLNAYLKYARVLEFQRDASVRDAQDFTKVW
ncbi:MAG: glycosyltransferase family 2 protein [Bacteroidales bacterium]|nr:glycosyltransferase family 2 protein [Bacteroidales bacterium]